MPLIIENMCVIMSFVGQTLVPLGYFFERGQVSCKHQTQVDR
jgi:hypothetical protein